MASDNYVQVGLCPATRDQLNAWAKGLKIKVTKGMDDLTVGEKVHKFCFSCDDDTWASLDPECAEWVNGITEKLNAIPAPAPEEKEEKKADAPPADVSPVDVIGACKTKKAVVEAAKQLGSKLKIVMGWKLADMKTKVIADILSCEAPAPEKKAAPARVKADATAQDPSPAAVKRAKANAKATAEAKKSKEGARTQEPGEPFCRNTTAWMIWDVVQRAGKEGLTVAEVKEQFIKDYEAQSELTSTNPAGRVGIIMSVMRKKNVIEDNGKGGWRFNKDFDK